MNTQYIKPLPGILGGMGTVSTLQFINSINKYDRLIKEISQEQHFSTYILFNKANISDRTASINKNDYTEICHELKEGIKNLIAARVDYIVPLCFTAFSVLTSLEAKFKEKIISIPYIALDLLAKHNKKSLIFCTEGSKKSDVFKQQENWHLVENLIVWPEDSDQKAIHDMIYKIKIHKIKTQDAVNFTESLCKKYGTNSFISGCTEVHIVAAKIALNDKKNTDHFQPIDPLLFVANHIAHDLPFNKKYFLK